jgi:hypothetical protein
VEMGEKIKLRILRKNVLLSPVFPKNGTTLSDNMVLRYHGE